MVMRHLQLENAAPLSRIAAATGLQRTNLVRREWATALSAAAGHDTEHLGAALALLTAVETGLARTRPRIRATRPAAES
jgi:hypothetical protein